MSILKHTGFINRVYISFVTQFVTNSGKFYVNLNQGEFYSDPRLGSMILFHVFYDSLTGAVLEVNYPKYLSTWPSMQSPL